MSSRNVEQRTGKGESTTFMLVCVCSCVRARLRACNHFWSRPSRPRWFGTQVWVSYSSTSAVNALPPPPSGQASEQLDCFSNPGWRQTRVALHEVPALSPSGDGHALTSTIRVPFLVHGQAHCHT